MIDYLAKDYQSFRRLMLDRLSAELPEWRERSPADLGVTLVELLAYAADQLSFRQDAAATEAYLETARERISVRRHLRLLGYRLHDGSSARVWLHVALDPTAAAVELPAGTRLLTHAGQLQTSPAPAAGATFSLPGHLPTVLPYPSAEYDAAIEQGSLVFETAHPLHCRPQLAALELHAPGVDRFVLERGATSLALRGRPRGLAQGDLLLLEAVADSDTGQPPADPSQRHVARLAAPPQPARDRATGEPITEIRLHDEDRLPAPLVVAAVVGGERRTGLAVARGNLVLAEHGETVRELLPRAGGGAPWRPRLSFPGLAWSEPCDPLEASSRPARHALRQQPHRALPAISLVEVDEHGEAIGEPWLPRHDLLESSAFAQEFVVETDGDGSARLRFGDGRLGRRPLPGTRFRATYRIGAGPAGQIGSDALAHVVETRLEPPDLRRQLGRLADRDGVQLDDGAAAVIAETGIGSSEELEVVWMRTLRCCAERGMELNAGNAAAAAGYVPQLVERRAQLERAAAERGLALDGELVELVARHPAADLMGIAGALDRVLRAAERAAQPPTTGLAREVLARRLDVASVRNPLPAAGGEPPEPLSRARLLAPRHFRRRRSCVTPEDWRGRARRLPEVLDAVARHRCTGGWTTVMLHVHRRGGRPVDQAFRRRLLAELEPALLADRDLEIHPPGLLPLAVALAVEVDAGYIAEAVRQQILARLGSGETAEGEPAFFHPDRFGFGSSLHLTDLVDEAARVEGVLLAQPRQFRPLADDDGPEIRDRIDPGPLEIPSLRRGLGRAALGRLSVTASGGA